MSSCGLNDIPEYARQDHAVDNSKLIVWDYLVKWDAGLPAGTDAGSGGASLLERYFQLNSYAKQQFDGDLNKVKAAVFTKDRKIPATVPPDIAQW